MSSTTTSCSRTPGPRPATISSAGSSRSRSSSLAGIVYPRLRAGARATIALLAGFFGVLAGTEAVLLHEDRRSVRRRLQRAPRRSRPACCLIGLGAVTLWRSRRTDDRPWWRYLRRLLLVAAAFVLVSAVLFPFSIAYVVTHAARATVPTADLGAPYENVEFRTADGLLLKGWYIRSRNGAAVISFPGRASSQKRAKLLARHGYGVLLFDRRGEGESEGDPNTFGWQGERDIHAAVAFLQRQKDVDPRADRRHRALRRRRDDDRGGGGVRRAQGDRLRGRERPICPGRAS